MKLVRFTTSQSWGNRLNVHLWFFPLQFLCTIELLVSQRQFNGFEPSRTACSISLKDVNLASCSKWPRTGSVILQGYRQFKVVKVVLNSLMKVSQVDRVKL